jgi:transposase-like protein
MGCPIGTSSNYSPSAVSKSITSPSIGGCTVSTRCSPTPTAFARRSPGDRWYVDETYIKVNGVWRYVYRAVDQYGHVIDVLVSKPRDGHVARRFFTRALTTLKVTPTEVINDKAPTYPRVLDELVPSAWHHVDGVLRRQDHRKFQGGHRPRLKLLTTPTATPIGSAARPRAATPGVACGS